MKRGISGTLALTTDTKMKEIIRALWRNIIIEKINVKWHPDGIILSEDVDNPNITSYTSGEIFIHLWYELTRAQIAVLGNENYHPERRWTVEGATVTLATDDIYYMFAKVPIDEEETVATIEFSDTYRFEEFYPGFIYILMAIGNVPNPDRVWATLWNGVTFIPHALPTIVTQWVVTGDSHCEVVSGYNTGYNLVEYKEQYRTGSDNWIDSDTPTRWVPQTDHTSCPVLLFGIWTSCGEPDYNYGHEFQLTYTENTVILVHSLLEAGMNYVFFSVPANKKLRIYNAMNIKVYDSDFPDDPNTNFSIVDTESRDGYHDNNIYRSDSTFLTSSSVVFTLVIYN